MVNSYYPQYDVMREQEAWDDHTRNIVTSRLHEAGFTQYLTESERRQLMELARVLLDEVRTSVLLYIVSHVDRTLESNIGESQRNPKVPEVQTLVRDGLRRLVDTVRSAYGKPFGQISSEQQQEVVELWSKGQFHPDQWNGTPQQPFFNKLLHMMVEAYASHPQIWSDIGYGGPAYPRGYIRAQIGQTDPWEAKLES